MNLSYSFGFSANDGITKNMYMGFQAALTYPSVDALAKRIFTIGNDCYMFKTDIERVFRQLPLDPADYPMIGFI